MIAERLESALPQWMHELTHWVNLAVTIALGVDALIDGVQEFAFAAMPGQNRFGPNLGGFINHDALPFLGRDRRIVRGFTEGPEDYAYRLRHFREAHKLAGIPYGTLGQLRGVLAPNPPRVRIVNGRGCWHSFEPDGRFRFHRTDGVGFEISADGSSSTPITVPAHPWNWDGDQTSARFWPIIYAPTNAPLDGDGGVYGLTRTYGTPNETLGTSSTVPHIEMLKALLYDWKTAGIPIENIIIAYDPASFDPETPGPYPAAGMPDGTWHHHGRIVDIGGGHLQRQSTRLATARYWKGIT